jgi:hypothetical protein
MCIQLWNHTHQSCFGYKQVSTQTVSATMSDLEVSPDITVFHMYPGGTPAREVRNYKKALREAYMLCSTVLLRSLKPAGTWNNAQQGSELEDTRLLLIAKATDMCEKLIAELHESEHSLPLNSAVYGAQLVTLGKTLHKTAKLAGAPSLARTVLNGPMRENAPSP